MKKLTIEKNIVDDVSFGAIVKIRDQLLEMQRKGEKVFRLESGDPSFTLEGHIKNAIIDAIKNDKTHYTDSTGIPELRKAISEKLKRKNGIMDADTDNVLVTNGGMNAIYVAFRSLLNNGDKVIIPDPMWTEIAEIIKLSGGTPVYMPSQNFVESIEKTRFQNLKAIFINSPHNPTGKVFTGNEFKKIIDFASDNALFLISDEAYEDVIFDGRKNFSPGSKYENTISLYSMSKTYAMSGLRIGYIHARDKKILERMRKMLRVTINGVNSITQYGAVAALNGPQDFVDLMKKEYQKRRDIIYYAVKDSKFLTPIKPEGAFYLWCKINEKPEGVHNSWDMSEFILKKTGVGSTPGPVFGPSGEDYIRFAFSADTKIIEEASSILKNLE
ncbi:MAG: pyridoxal phosphate-dependent aminotransferase [Thermoplasmata archaeon]